MKIDNPLTREFLLSYPVEAARVLEQISVEQVAGYLIQLSTQASSAVLTHMLPVNAASCFNAMEDTLAAKLLNELPVSSIVRIYRLLPHEKQNELLRHLPEKQRDKIHSRLEYPIDSVGTVLDTDMTVLPENINVAEAFRRIERMHHSIACDIYVIDNQHHLTGIVELGRLLASKQRVQLRDIMNRKTQSVTTHTSVKSVLEHPGWLSRRRLPVVERDNTLAGVLKYERLLETTAQAEAHRRRDPLENLLTLADLYSLSMAQLLDSLMKTEPNRKANMQGKKK